MELNKESLEAATQGFQTTFNESLASVKTHYEGIAMVINSNNASEVYPMLMDTPGMREFVGERQIHSLGKAAFTIVNKDYEHTVGVPRSAITDDSLGIYNTKAADQARHAKVHPDILTFQLLKAGVSTLCWDGQNFFDTDHPVLDENGDESSYSNYAAGGEEIWIIADNSRRMRCVIYQNRLSPEFVALDNPNDPNVFMKNGLLYGVYSRGNVGYGLPQLAVASKEVLSAANFEKMQTLLEDRTGNYGEPLDINATTLYVTKGNRAAAKKIINTANLGNEGDNPNYKAVEVVVVPYLK